MGETASNNNFLHIDLCLLSQLVHRLKHKGQLKSFFKEQPNVLTLLRFSNGESTNKATQLTSSETCNISRILHTQKKKVYGNVLKINEKTDFIREKKLIVEPVQ